MTDCKSGPRWAQTSVLLGGLVWLGLSLPAALGPWRIGVIEKLLLLGLLVVVPLGLWLVATPDRHGRHALPYRLAVLLQPFGAGLAVCSFLFPPGAVAALLASGWLAVTACMACFGFTRFLPRSAARVEEVCIDAGLIYVMVGGGWFVISRLGWQPLGFGPVIVTLTAVHFHYAGFAAPLLAGFAGRVLDDSQRLARRMHRAASTCVIVGVPLVAAGITLSRELEFAATAVLSLGLFLLAASVLGWVVPTLRSRPARLLLGLSAGSSCVAMLLA